ncbi:hypothetical protein FSARC_4133 [Fusarium sarcochroum]|uniref:SET domain-containing protein n=1 Tax=Fusarium sarcochroum TaxID=1208366 RepID=A0A8H4U2D1_9HYPO|nr:hypothetical protein FSARC_4133 [Fusarium sarcochroum]
MIQSPKEGSAPKQSPEALSGMFKLTVEAEENEVDDNESIGKDTFVILEATETGSDTSTMTLNVCFPPLIPHEPPPSSSQPNGGAIRETGTSYGVGLIAERDLPRKHNIIENEPPILSCHFKAVGNKYLRKIPTGRQLSLREQGNLQNLVRDYAFNDPQGRWALIFELTSHINHACMSCASAQFTVDPEYPYEITVTLVRDVQKDEEVFIHYNKSVVKNLHGRLHLSQIIHNENENENRDVEHEPTITKRFGQGFKSLLNKIDPRKLFRRAHQDDVMEN